MRLGRGGGTGALLGLGTLLFVRTGLGILGPCLTQAAQTLAVSACCIRQ